MVAEEIIVSTELSFEVSRACSELCIRLLLLRWCVRLLVAPGDLKQSDGGNKKIWRALCVEEHLVGRVGARFELCVYQWFRVVALTKVMAYGRWWKRDKLLLQGGGRLSQKQGWKWGFDSLDRREFRGLWGKMVMLVWSLSEEELRVDSSEVCVYWESFLENKSKRERPRIHVLYVERESHGEKGKKYSLDQWLVEEFIFMKDRVITMRGCITFNKWREFMPAMHRVTFSLSITWLFFSIWKVKSIIFTAILVYSLIGGLSSLSFLSSIEV